ncbi:bifunctional 3-demethylubiquinone-9 3-methyltransferase/ 2-octaprenyl-6-hydroxy phenol methylase [Posidoniimonas polymericola]|uniref:Bifunctional 3-demethylubiquinone-9 3-methyltransferase/ 2-octaprenyl-6-hydroxy phenol methylase n=1 Tax=Posidoniimonas polymericola TaxID=2528002 RepID=A0A5C5YAN8_9BACT|nr:class I SAM-dependent methyltransferase [Posidoniimonas polymericola]TWT72757.1 bifunctional 3-demethylubiquinone-9 3-methyltransferase/ 2-octaprenyl-6-hydroxy phenol methylase [Posidoniimonas polymericola]
MPNHPNEQAMIHAWRANATAWADAVRGDKIASRVAVTNEAIVNAVTTLKPRSVLDVGCGEGWLARELTKRGADVLGVDAIVDLVEQARAVGGGAFEQHSYDELAAGSVPRRFDAVVCNFSLFTDHSVERLFGRIPEMLNPGGHCVVQTLHPITAPGDLPYKDGWRDGFWDGLGEGFLDAPRWYFRTLASWVRLFSCCGLKIVQIVEPTAQDGSRPSSLILVGQKS